MNQTKKIRYLLLGTLLLSALSFDMGQAADISPAKPAANAGIQVEKPGKDMGMRKRQPYSMEEKIQILHGKYDISEDAARNLLKEDIPFRDLDRICL